MIAIVAIGVFVAPGGLPRRGHPDARVPARSGDTWRQVRRALRGEDAAKAAFPLSVVEVGA